MNPNENTHDSLVEQALVGFDLAAEHHLANCDACQGERERVEDALRLFGAASREHAQRSEAFWEQQASRIKAARSERAQRSRITLALAPGLAALLVVAFLLLSPVPERAPVPVRAQNDYDHELLVEVERAVQTGTPRSLEAVTLMVEETDRRQGMSSSNSLKERRSHEN